MQSDCEQYVASDVIIDTVALGIDPQRPRRSPPVDSEETGEKSNQQEQLIEPESQSFYLAQRGTSPIHF